MMFLTCGPDHPLPGCNRAIWLAVGIGLTLLLLALVCGATVSFVRAAPVAVSTDCPSAAYRVEVNATQYPKGANIRSDPPIAGTLQPIIGFLLPATPAEARDLRENWYQLCAEGYISGAVLLVTAYTPTPPSSTPTRIPTSTPTATPHLGVLLIDADGSGDYETIINCVMPCAMKLGDTP